MITKKDIGKIVRVTDNDKGDITNLKGTIGIFSSIIPEIFDGYRYAVIKIINTPNTKLMNDLEADSDYAVKICNLELI